VVIAMDLEDLLRLNKLRSDLQPVARVVGPSERAQPRQHERLVPARRAASGAALMTARQMFILA
jgi:hypothetical protein